MMMIIEEKISILEANYLTTVCIKECVKNMS